MNRVHPRRYPAPRCPIPGFNSVTAPPWTSAYNGRVILFSTQYAK